MVEGAAVDANTVFVVLFSVHQYVSVPHQINLVRGDEWKCRIFQLEKPVVVDHSLLQKGVVGKARTRDLPQEAGLTL